jgi:hypothetical protein
VRLTFAAPVPVLFCPMKASAMPYKVTLDCPNDEPVNARTAAATAAFLKDIVISYLRLSFVDFIKSNELKQNLLS